MKGRIRKKRKKQAYMEALERGNLYLKDALMRQEALYNKQIDFLRAKDQLTEMLLYASVIKAGGSVEIETKGLGEMLNSKEIKQRADYDSHTVYITVKDKAVLDDGKSD